MPCRGEGDIAIFKYIAVHCEIIISWASQENFTTKQLIGKLLVLG